MTRRRRNAVAPQVTLEALEGRALLSAAPAVVTAAVTNGALNVVGTKGNDSILVAHNAADATKLDVTSGGQLVGSFNVADVLAGGVRVFAGNGNDEVRIDAGVELRAVVFGGNGNDFLAGGGGADVLSGGNGNDTVKGGAGKDLIGGGNGNDTLDGDDDDATTEDGDDVIFGGNGADTLTGRGGNDYLFGGNAPDTIDGGDGNDFIRGGNSKDAVTGGAGADMLGGRDFALEVTDKTGEDTLLSLKRDDDGGHGGEEGLLSDLEKSMNKGRRK